MIKQLPSYETTIKAIRGGKDPMAFLHLGILYAQGIGTEQNDVLADYFLKKSLDMGCKEAEEYLVVEYESGKKDFAAEFKSYIGEDGSASRETIAKLRARVEVERKAKNYGNLSRIRNHLTIIYPEYNREKAIKDILHSRDSIDADILYTLSTADNRSEVFLESQDRLLQQLYAPITTDSWLYDTITKLDDIDLLGKDESELAQCIVNLTSSYKTICKKNAIEPKEIYSLDSLRLYPYIRISNLVLLRWQGLKGLLSIKDVEPAIHDKFLNCLDSDEKLLNVCEEVKDQDLQLFLISFVELNIDIESLEIDSLALLKAYRNKDLEPLAKHINAFLDRLNKVGIKHYLSHYTVGQLPPIDLSKEYADSSVQQNSINN